MTAIVIVGAGPGIGAATARRFAREGFDVGLVCRQPARLSALVTELRGLGVAAAAEAADAGDERALAGALERLAASLGAPAVLLCNAAAFRNRPPLTLGVGELVDDFRVGVASALVAVQALLPALRAARGSVLLTGGGYAFGPDPMLLTLGLQKAALRNLAFGLHDALKPDGVHVATATVMGAVGSTPALAADAIAQAYWDAHARRGEAEIRIG